MNIFLTGDRSMPPPLAIMFAASAVAQTGIEASQGDIQVTFSTGDNAGFEEGVRGILTALKIDFTVYPTGLNPDTQKPAWDVRHEVVNAACDRVIFVHADPLSSSIGASAMKVFGDKLVIAGS